MIKFGVTQADAPTDENLDEKGKERWMIAE